MSHCRICDYCPDLDNSKTKENFISESKDICVRCSSVIEETLAEYDWDEEEMKLDYTDSIPQDEKDVNNNLTENPCGGPECGRFCECDLGSSTRIDAKAIRKPVQSQEQASPYHPSQEQERPPQRKFGHV